MSNERNVVVASAGCKLRMICAFVITFFLSMIIAASYLIYYSMREEDVIEGMLASADVDERLKCIRHLCRNKSEAVRHVPTLQKLITDENKETKLAAIKCLGLLEKQGIPALPSLRVSLNDRDRRVRVAAAQAISMIDPGDNTPILPLAKALIESSDEKEETNLLMIIETIGRFGPRAEPALPRLIVLLGDKDSGVRVASAQTIGTIGSNAKTAVDSLAKRLKDDDKHVRVAAAESLGRIGMPAQNAVGALIAEIHTNDSRFKIALIQSIGRIGQDPDLSVKALLSVIRDEGGNEKVLSHAIQSLGFFSERKEMIIPMISKYRSHENELVREVTRAVLAKFAQSPNVID